MNQQGNKFIIAWKICMFENQNLKYEGSWKDPIAEDLNLWALPIIKHKTKVIINLNICKGKVLPCIPYDWERSYTYL